LDGVFPGKRALNGRQVKVQGTVIRVPGPGAWLPSLRVIGKPTPVPE